MQHDNTEALNWYRKAADQGLSLAQSKLGLVCENDEGVSEDHAGTVKLYRTAAVQGQRLAQYLIGIMYAQGQGEPQDWVQAHIWVSLATSIGMESAKN